MKNILTVLTVLLLANTANAAGPVGSAIAPPTYVNYIVEKGDLGWVSKNYQNTYNIDMPFAAHALCEFEFPGTRAAEYDDFKYIYAKLSTLSNGKYIVLNPFTSKSGTKYLAKTGQQFTIAAPQADQFCKNYTDSTDSYQTIVLDTSTNRLAIQNCDQSVRIACVKD